MDTQPIEAIVIETLATIGVNNLHTIITYLAIKISSRTFHHTRIIDNVCRLTVISYLNRLRLSGITIGTHLDGHRAVYLRTVTKLTAVVRTPAIHTSTLHA
ncbi:hypothetical protein D3C87_1799900 [compost metagenome]